MYLPLSPLLNEAVTIELAFTPLTENASETLLPIVKVPNLNAEIDVPPEALMMGKSRKIWNGC